MRKGSHHSDETKRRLSEIQQGRKYSPEIVERRAASNRGKKHHMPPDWREHVADSNRRRIAEFGAWNKGRIGYKHTGSFKSGDQHWNWRGGLTPSDKLFRRTDEYKAWRKAVFHRDDYRCIDCGARSEKGNRIELHPDHLYPFSAYPGLRYVIENGITRCAPCHRLTPTYGFRLNNNPTAHAYTGLILR